MARVVKLRDVRRSELLDCAQKLFFERSYERTTINDVIEAAGVSKGGFYHHFQAKEDLLEALASRLALQSIARFTDILDNQDMDALGRLNAFFARGRQIKAEDARQLAAAFDPLLKPENTLLYHRIYAAMAAVMTPVLEHIIQQGIAEGAFKVTHPAAAADIILQLSTANRSVRADLAAASGKLAATAARVVLEERLLFQGLVVDRMLGLPDCSVDLVGSARRRPSP